MKLFGSTKKKYMQNKEWRKCTKSWSCLVQCNLVDNQYQQKFEVLYTFMPNKSYTSLLNQNVETSNLVFLKT